MLPFTRTHHVEHSHNAALRARAHGGSHRTLKPQRRRSPCVKAKVKFRQVLPGFAMAIPITGFDRFSHRRLGQRHWPRGRRHVGLSAYEGLCFGRGERGGGEFIEDGRRCTKCPNLGHLVLEPFTHPGIIHPSALSAARISANCSAYSSSSTVTAAAARSSCSSSATVRRVARVFERDRAQVTSL